MKKASRTVPRIDIGLIWAKGVNIWGQLGTVAGVANTLMLVGVFYTTTVYPNFRIPLWLYIPLIALAASLWICFIVRFGISGYYRFFSNQSEMSEINRKVSAIMKHLDIAEEYERNRRKKKK